MHVYDKLSGDPSFPENSCEKSWRTLYVIDNNDICKLLVRSAPRPTPWNAKIRKSRERQTEREFEFERERAGRICGAQLMLGFQNDPLSSSSDLARNDSAVGMCLFILTNLASSSAIVSIRLSVRVIE
jgi:hypothetical protein